MKSIIISIAITILAQPLFAETKKVPAIRADDPEIREIMDQYEPDAHLFQKDMKALEKVDEYFNNEMQIKRDDEGRIIMTYGDSLTTIVCAPVVVCVLELQPGEKIVGKHHLGDTVRWAVNLENSRRDGQTVRNLIIKPNDINIATNLFIPTDRRSYNIRLVSKSKTYMPRVAFQYPNDDLLHSLKLAKYKEKEAQKKQAYNLIKKNYYYDIEGDKEILPLSVYDDGTKTYILMSSEIQTLPALLLKGSSKKNKYKIVNFRVKEPNTYVVDRLFTDKGILVLNAGKAEKKVTITRMDSFDGRGNRLVLSSNERNHEVDK